MKHPFFFIALCFLVGALWACRAAPRSVTPAPAVQAQITATHTYTPTAMPTSTHTSTPSPSATSTAKATSTSRPTNTPAAPTNTPAPTATLDPTAQAIAATVESAEADRYFLLDPSHPEEYEPFPADANLNFYRPREFALDAILSEEDVNHDGQIDLIVHSHQALSIFLRRGENYDPPFIFVAYNSGASSAVRYALEDWTGDNLSEIVLYFRSSNFIGTGAVSVTWSQTIVQCSEFICHTIWSYQPAFALGYSYAGGVAISRQRAILEATEETSPTIRLKEEVFNLQAMEVRYPADNARVFTSTQQIFLWNGTIFEPISEEIISPATNIEPAESLENTSPQGDQLTINWWPNNQVDQRNDVCQLLINDAQAGNLFGCKHSYTVGLWRDVTGDDQFEAVVFTTSGSAPIDDQRNVLNDIECVHQRMLIFQQMNQDWIEIANIAGCVRQGDLFGVRLEDYDQDGVIDIVAADKNLLTTTDCIAPETSFADNCWQELNTDILIYRWDGNAFTLSERVSGN